MAFVSQMSNQDDSGDVLMGLQELDSHLAIFDETPALNKVSAPSSPLSDQESEQFLDALETTSSADKEETHDDQLPSGTVNGAISAQNHVDKPEEEAKIYKSEQLLTAAPACLTQIKSELAIDSMTSSILTDATDNSSAISSLSSKATSPADFDTRSREHTHMSLPGRHKFNVRPRVSIPTDIAASEYARQCIAAAESSRLNPFTLHPDEYNMLRNHISPAQVTTYLNLRNGILRLWIRNPLIGVMRDEAVGCAKDSRWFDVANICYEWLMRMGYINFGCLENTSFQNSNTLQRGMKRKRKTIVVIGAGISGLGCARQLEGLVAQLEDRFIEKGEDPPKVVVLEGRDRIGGRVYSRAFKSKPEVSNLPEGSRCTAEMGGMIITGFDRGNPLNVIVRGQLALPYHALRPTTTLYDSDGRPVDQRQDHLAEKLYNDVLERVSDYKFKIDQPHTVDGDRDMVYAGRDTTSENTKTIADVEAAAALGMKSSKISISSGPAPEVVPVSSDRLTGRANLEPGIPAVHKAAYKAKMMGWSLKQGINEDYDLDLESDAKADHSTMGSVMDAAIHKYMDVVDINPQILRLINWHVANLEYSNAISTRELSLGGWDVDAGNEWEGKHTQIIGGYQQVPRGLLNCPTPLEVLKKSPVKTIRYDSTLESKTSLIECEDGSAFEADYIVSTIPLGVLKNQNIAFDPPLPEWKTGAIERLGFGVLNKVVLVYQQPFWDESRDIFGVLQNATIPDSLNQKDYAAPRGRFFQWWNCTNSSGLPCLIALMAGDAAFSTERSGNKELVAEATAVLRRVFGSHVPQPIEAVVTRWGQDRFARGSYSYTGPNFKYDDYETMAKPIGNLFFGGEHTCGTHPATVHGAYMSGLRAASEVIDAMLGPIQIPDPLILPKESLLAINKRKAEEMAQAEIKNPTQARLEAYERELWDAAYIALGPRPLQPPKIAANPYILYSKEKYEAAKQRCDEGRRPGKSKAVPNEVRGMLAKMWKEAPQDEKKPFIENAEQLKQRYAELINEFKTAVKKWDEDALIFRRKYEREHPSLPGPDESIEGWDSPGRRDRRAKRVSTAGAYVEKSESEDEEVEEGDEDVDMDN